MDEEQTQEVSRRFRSMTKLAVFFALVAGFSFVGGIAVGSNGTTVFDHVPLLGDGLDATPDASADLNDFWKAWNTLSTRFVQTHGTSTPPIAKERLWGAIQGLAQSFGDPYTVYMPPEEAKIFAEDISGVFTGVGMEIGVKNGILTVIAPLKNTPAERAGIRSGDQVVLINGESTDGLSTDEAVKMIRGPEGTDVNFRIIRNTEGLDITVTRAVIETPVIANSMDQATGVYTISLYSFTANSGALFNRALAEFRTSGSNKLLIDLRGNPGGYLAAAVAIGSNFLPSGAEIVTEDYNGNRENIVHRSRGTGGVPEGTKIVVLIDQGSASASEILAGALQDGKVATLIGTRSFGKGSVQELVEIGGGSLKITVARWLTPSGRSISDGGLTPDIEVKLTEEDVKNANDLQKKRALEFLQTGK